MTKKAKASPEAASDLLNTFLTGLKSGFQTDINLETKDGVELDYGKYGKFIMRRAVARNHAFTKAIRDELTPYIDRRGSVEGEDQKAVEIMARIYANTIITGIKTSDGVSIPYDAAAKKQLAQILCDAPDLFERIQRDSQDAENFRQKKIEAEAKN